MGRRPTREEAWALRHPDEHLKHAPEILRAAGWSEEWIRAVLSHGWGLCTDAEPRTALEKTLYAFDELTGLVAAAGVNRSVIERGAALLGVPLDGLVADTIEGVRTVAAEIGLKRNP